LDVMEVIKARRSIRKFRKDPVPEEALEKLIEAFKSAPSSKNTQPWRLVIIRDKGTLRRLADLTKYGKFLSEAPLAIAVVACPKKSDWAIVDATLATYNMVLVAAEMGLGTCWIGTMDREGAKELLGSAGGHVPPDGDPGRLPGRDRRPQRPRKPVECGVYYERYGRKAPPAAMAA
jgi:nitroreductase